MHCALADTATLDADAAEAAKQARHEALTATLSQQSVGRERRDRNQDMKPGEKGSALERSPLRHQVAFTSVKMCSVAHAPGTGCAVLPGVNCEQPAMLD